MNEFSVSYDRVISVVSNINDSRKPIPEKINSMGSRRKPIPEKIQGRLTKFFVSKLPKKCSGNNLADFVRQHGEIFDLYIARKRDRFGNRFGFVTMLDVKDKQEMVRILVLFVWVTTGYTTKKNAV